MLSWHGSNRSSFLLISIFRCSSVPSLCGLRIDDDLHKPPQDGGSCRPGRLFPSIMLLPALHRKLRSGIKIHCILPDSAASAPHSQPELLLSVYIFLYDLHFAATCKSRLRIHPPIFFQPYFTTPFFKIMLAYWAFSPVATTQYAFLARS